MMVPIDRARPASALGGCLADGAVEGFFRDGEREAADEDIAQPVESVFHQVLIAQHDFALVQPRRLDRGDAREAGVEHFEQVG